MFRRKLFGTLLFILIFIGSVLTFNFIQNRNRTTRAVEGYDPTMAKAYILYDGRVLNSMLGYTNTIDTSLYRESVTVFENGNQINVLLSDSVDTSADVKYDKQRFLQYLVEAEKFVAHEDFLIADELWSFLAGSDGAMQEILDIINAIATPEFMDKFEQIQDVNTDVEIRREIFNEWHLYSEIHILDNISRTPSNSRIYNQTVFKTDGAYNTNRLRLLE